MWDRIKKALEVVDPLHKAIGLLIWLGGVVGSSFAIRSSTLRLWVIGGGVLGAGLGYYVTTQWWGGEGKRNCKRACIVSASLAFVALVCFVFLLLVLRPDFASLHPSFASVREVLLRSGFLPNLLGFLFFGATIWFAVSAVTLLSSKLWETPP